MKYEGTVCTFLYYLYYKFTRIENKLNTFFKKKVSQLLDYSFENCIQISKTTYHSLNAVRCSNHVLTVAISTKSTTIDSCMQGICLTAVSHSSTIGTVLKSANT